MPGRTQPQGCIHGDDEVSTQNDALPAPETGSTNPIDVEDKELAEYNRRIEALGIEDLFAARHERVAGVVQRDPGIDLDNSVVGGTKAIRAGLIAELRQKLGLAQQGAGCVVDEDSVLKAAVRAVLCLDWRHNPTQEHQHVTGELQAEFPGVAWTTDLLRAVITTARLDARLMRSREIARLINQVDTVGPVSRQEQTLAIAEAMRAVFEYVPRDNQIEAVRHLLFDQSDLILSARTSFGKSTVIQSPSTLTNSLTLIILPLNSIGLEQEEKLRKIGATPFRINSDTRNDLTKSELVALENGQYSHILLSPEAATSDWFRRVLAKPAFQKRVGFVVVDEAHLVEQWGAKFREEYARLRFLRTVLPGQCVWFACSATLDPLTLTQVKLGAGFRQSSTRLIRESTNRPEVFLQVAALPKGSVRSYEGLFFLLDSAGSLQQPEPIRIEKTVVFLDSKADTATAARVLRDRLRAKHGFTRQQALATVGVIHSAVGERDQNRILERFRAEDSAVRIIVATETLGMGVDLPDICRIVQYNIPIQEHLNVLAQRGGRAAREAGRTGCFTFLVDPAVLAKHCEPDLDEVDRNLMVQTHVAVRRLMREEGLTRTAWRSDKKKLEALVAQQKTIAKTYRDTWAEAFWAFATTSGCRRRVLLRFYEDPKFQAMKDAGETDSGAVRRLQSGQPCCDNCNPDRALHLPAEWKEDADVYFEQVARDSLARKLRGECREAAVKRWTGAAFDPSMCTWYTDFFLYRLAKEALSQRRSSGRDLLSSKADLTAYCERMGGECAALDPVNGAAEKEIEWLWRRICELRTDARAAAYLKSRKRAQEQSQKKTKIAQDKDHPQVQTSAGVEAPRKRPRVTEVAKVAPFAEASNAAAGSSFTSTATDAPTVFSDNAAQVDTASSVGGSPFSVRSSPAKSPAAKRPRRPAPSPSPTPTRRRPLWELPANATPGRRRKDGAPAQTGSPAAPMSSPVSVSTRVGRQTSLPARYQT